MERTSMTREQVFARLRELGAVVALVEYHGGNDESCIEEPKLYTVPRDRVDHDTTPLPLLGGVHYFDNQTDGTSPKPLPDENALSDTLSAPIEETLSEFFGDGVGGVDGTLVWYVESEQVILEHSYQDWRTKEWAVT